MSAGCLFGESLNGSEEAATDGAATTPVKRRTQVVTAPIAAVTAPAGTPISIIVDRGLTLQSPAGTDFEGRTSAAFKVGNFTIVAAGARVRGIARGIGEGREGFPRGSPDLVPTLTGILIGEKWEQINAVPAREQDTSGPATSEAPAKSPAPRTVSDTQEVEPAESAIILSGPALQIPKGARLTFDLAESFFTILTLDSYTAP